MFAVLSRLLANYLREKLGPPGEAALDQNTQARVDQKMTD
jgi:hypothetical protein